MSSTQNNNQKKQQNKQKKNNANQNRQQRRRVRKRKPVKERKLQLQVDITKPSQGTRENIMVLAPVESLVAECMPMALIARAIVFGQNTAASPVYWAYVALMEDIINILSNKVSPVPSRLNYLNEILQSWKPKNVPFKTGTLSYSWSGVDTILPDSTSLNVRNYKTYMYVNSGSVFGPWELQTPPISPSTPDQTYQKLSTVYTTIGNLRYKSLQYEPARTESEYSLDTSAFASASSYYGVDVVPSIGPSYSIENEVPFKSSQFGGLTTYSPANGRVARVYSLASGGPVEALGAPFLPGFDTKFFKSAYPVQYKFIDLDEVCAVLAEWYARCVGLIFQTRSSPTYNSQTDFSLTPFPYTPQQFRILVRQAITSFMGPSCAMTQFMSYTDDRNGFEPFRMGSNCAPVNRFEMRMPETLVENLRMLLPAYGHIKTKYPNDKNVVLYVPVWGIYKSVEYAPYNAVGTFYTEYGGGFLANESLLFTGTYGDDPSPIDGSTSGGQCVDLNSPLISQFLAEWNDRVTTFTAVSGPTAFLAGSAPTTLLMHNRYCIFKEGQQISWDKVPAYYQRRIPKCAIRDVPTPVQQKKITRSISTGDNSKVETMKVFIPPAFSLFTQVDQAYASTVTLTEELRNLFQYVILPSIAITPGESPQQKSVRTQNLEFDVLDLTTSTDVFSSRAVQLAIYAGILSPGLATGGTSDELISVIHEMATTGKGGFLGELLLGAANVILPNLPI